MTIVLVLGATGFIGGHIALAALRQGWQVRALRRRTGAIGHLGRSPVLWSDGDLDRPESLPPAFEGVEIVFHAAGYYPRSNDPVHCQVAFSVRQTRSVLEAAHRAGVARLVYVSSLTTIGRPPPDEDRLADERDHYVPGTLARSAYYECKYAMESEVLRADSSVPCVVVSPTAVFGPGDVHLTLARLLLALARGWGVAWLPAEVNAVDVRDVAEATVRAAQLGRPGERYLLGGHNLSVRQLMELTCRTAGVPPPRFQIPLWLIDRVISITDHFPPLNLAGNHLRAIRQWQGYNCEKARHELGLSTRPLETTMRDAFDWLASQGHKLPPRSVV